MNPSQHIDKQIADLGDWREGIFKAFRKYVLAADSNIVEEWKWDTAVWSCNGLVCAVGTFKDHLKLNFFQGSVLADPHKIFNAGHEAKKTRAIDVYENNKLNESAIKDLIRAAVEYNNRK